jgi:hypothetical protein
LVIPSWQDGDVFQVSVGGNAGYNAVSIQGKFPNFGQKIDQIRFPGKAIIHCLLISCGETNDQKP